MVGRDVTSCFVSFNLFLNFVLFVPSVPSCSVYCDWIYCFTRAGSLVFSVLQLSYFDNCLSQPPSTYPDGEVIEFSSKVNPTTKPQCDSLLLLLLPWLVCGSSHSLPRKKQLQALAIYTLLEPSPTQPAQHMLYVWAHLPYT